MASGSVSGSESYTTPGTYYWTAPAGATKVDVTGQGGSSTSTQAWSTSANILSMMWRADGTSTLATPIGSSWTYEDAEAVMASLASTGNTITTSSNGAYYDFLDRRVFYKVSGNWYTTYYENRWSSYKLRRTGTYTTSYNFGTGEVNDTWYQTRYPTGASIERLGTNTTYGTDSTAFSQTFQNNSGQATYTEVPVVAGTQYTIVVGVDEGSDTASVSFDYY
tara:strand:+ start:323 stop:985 length:663 start_codon:yes stop_codon:yes gene_type:complete